MTNKTAAARYARALFDVAVKEGANLEQLETAVAGFADLFRANPALEKVLLNPAVPVPRKRAVVEQISALAQVPPILAKLLALLAERDRLVLLPDLVAAFRERVMDYRRVVRAEVTTAEPIDAGKVDAIQRGLASVTGRTVTVATKVDPSIIGGVVARVGSTVYDASVVRQLERLRAQLESV
jgi:F-type H+-transporting ATPase subunit delta